MLHSCTLFSFCPYYIKKLIIKYILHFGKIIAGMSPSLETIGGSDHEVDKVNGVFYKIV